MMADSHQRSVPFEFDEAAIMMTYPNHYSKGRGCYLVLNGRGIINLAKIHPSSCKYGYTEGVAAYMDDPHSKHYFNPLVVGHHFINYPFKKDGKRWQNGAVQESSFRYYDPRIPQPFNEAQEEWKKSLITQHKIPKYGEVPILMEKVNKELGLKYGRFVTRDTEFFLTHPLVEYLNTPPCPSGELLTIPDPHCIPEIWVNEDKIAMIKAQALTAQPGPELAARQPLSRRFPFRTIDKVDVKYEFRCVLTTAAKEIEPRMRTNQARSIGPFF